MINVGMREEHSRQRLRVESEFAILHRRLFPQMVEGLRPGGLLVFESLVLEPGQDAGGHCRDFFLRPNELLRAFLSLRVLHYREGPEQGTDDGRQLASLVARRI